VRTHRFVEQLRANQEPAGGDRDPPEPVGTVAFEDVSFAYEPDKPVLKGVSFEVRRGEFVGVVGPSGAGKSTVVSLLARVYEPDGGRITADGVPIDEMPVRAWRERVAMVRQDPHIFNDTLRYNLTTGREVDERALEEAAETACVTEFLDSLPDGYDTVLGDDGVKLSGGQRQRVALARALLTDAELLVLDEATSDLDSGLEREVHAALVESAAERTVVAIAHRLSTVRDADRILTMESGRVTEAGTHGDLVDSDGTYAELYALQRGEGD
jgi:subfamily B ATP-binding cassette protein MsbA